MNKFINKYIDHTLLKPDAGKKHLKMLFDEALKYDFHSVCVNSCHVDSASEYLKNSNVKVASVTGFPLGAMSTAAKLSETSDALHNGADEIDVVINIGALKDGDSKYVKNEINALTQLCHNYGKIIKVIIETCLLTNDEIVEACDIATVCHADFIKTSTGFSTGGAKLDDIRLMKKIIGDKARIKASGGIRTLDFAMELINAGADRLGCSASVSIMREYTAHDASQSS